MGVFERIVALVLMIIAAFGVLIVVLILQPDPGYEIIWWRVGVICVVILGLIAASVALWRAGGKKKAAGGTPPPSPPAET
jgi:Mn2+/Fe2+ NRAMP family transporter